MSTSTDIKFGTPDVTFREEFFSNTASLEARLWMSNYPLDVVTSRDWAVLWTLVPTYTLGTNTSHVRYADCIRYLECMAAYGTDEVSPEDAHR